MATTRTHAEECERVKLAMRRLRAERKKTQKEIMMDQAVYTVMKDLLNSLTDVLIQMNMCDEYEDKIQSIFGITTMKQIRSIREMLANTTADLVELSGKGYDVESERDED